MYVVVNTGPFHYDHAPPLGNVSIIDVGARLAGRLESAYGRRSDGTRRLPNSWGVFL
jgi:hypothetical protein